LKKKLKLNKKTLKNLKLTIKKLSDRKAAPYIVVPDDPLYVRSNGSSC